MTRPPVASPERRWPSSSTIGLVFLVFFLLANIAVTLHHTRSLRDDLASIRRSDQLLVALAQLSGLAQAGEDSVRGYVTTGLPAQLERYQQSVLGIDPALQSIAELMSVRSLQSERLASLRQDVVTGWQDLEELVATRRDLGPEAASVLLAGGRPWRAMDALRLHVADMTAEQQGLLDQRVGGRDATFRSALTAGVLAAIAAILCVALLVHRQWRRRAHDGALLREVAVRLRTILASIGDAVVATDLHGRVTEMNPAAEVLTGWASDDAVGQPLDMVYRLVEEELGLPIANSALRAIRAGESVGLEVHTLLIGKEGRERPVEENATPIRGQDGAIVGSVVVFRDVSERRRIEAERRDSARRMQALVDATTSIVWTTDEGGNFVAEQVSWRDYTGQTWHEHRRLGWLDAIHPDDRERVESRWREACAARSLYRSEGRLWHAATGAYRHFEARAVPNVDDDGTVSWVGMCVDVEDRRRLEEERMRLAALVENSGDFIGICDMDLVPVYVNQAGLEMVGLDDLDHARRMRVQDFFFPEDQQSIVEDFLPEVLKSGEGEVEIRFRHFVTGDPIWMLYRVFELCDESGERVGLATVSRDVTDRRLLEDDLRQLAADLSEADRRKNEFLAMLAHELRNPLAPIQNAVGLMQRQHDDPRAVQSAGDMIGRQVANMSRLVEDLLDISRISRGKIRLRRKRVDLLEAVRSAVEDAAPLRAAADHELVLDLPDERIDLDADPIRLAQAFSNLLSNAYKFTDRGGRVTLTVERKDDGVEIRIDDNGIGIAPEDLGSIFDMFVQVDTSLHRPFSGLGIGLPLVKSLIEMHEGEEAATSKGIGRGTQFVIHLPLAEPATSAAVVEGETSERPQEPANRRILLVDDNQDAVESLALLLELSGHTVYKAYDGLEALTIANSARPDVVLLDIGLPKRNGYDVAREIRQKPWGGDMTLIAVTGWGAADDRQRSRDAGFDSHLVKPVDYHKLMELLSAPT